MPPPVTRSVKQTFTSESLINFMILKPRGKTDFGFFMRDTRIDNKTLRDVLTEPWH